jgi:glycosyltransferase involved in cell wall biosynthesis
MPAVLDKNLVSVIVPCRNGARYIADVFDALNQQDFRGRWEVIFVDNGSTDGSGAMAAGHAADLDLKVVVANARANVCYARNAGVRAAAGDKLLFLDVDDRIDAHYISAMASALDSHDFVTSRVDSATLNPEWVRSAHGPPWQADGIMVFFDFLPAAGVNIGLRRALYEALGGFDEEFSASEDIALSWKAQLLHGTNIHFVTDAVYLYRNRDSLPALYRQSRTWGFSNTLLYRRFRDYGMPGRSLKIAAREWLEVMRLLYRARNRTMLAPAVVRLGYSVGRLGGSLRHRVVYP